jgi:hypothetical protein
MPCGEDDRMTNSVSHDLVRSRLKRIAHRLLYDTHLEGGRAALIAERGHYSVLPHLRWRRMARTGILDRHDDLSDRP